MVHNPEPHIEVYFNNRRFCLFQHCTYFHLWTSVSIISEIFKQIHLYTIVIIQGISTTFIDQMPTYLVFKKVHFMLG